MLFQDIRLVMELAFAPMRLGKGGAGGSEEELMEEVSDEAVRPGM